MRDRNTHSRLIVAALMLALAAILAGPASARPTPSANGSESTPTTVIPYLSHGMGVDESQFTGTGATATAPGLVIPYLSHGIGVDESLFNGTGATATAPGLVIPYLSHGIGVDKSQFTGTGTSTAAKSPALVIPYLSHGIGVDESQFTGTSATAKAPALVVPYLSHGIGVDESRFTGAAEQPSTATAAGGDGWNEWGVSGVAAGGGIAALLLATLGTLAYRSRHGRTAMS